MGRGWSAGTRIAPRTLQPKMVLIVTVISMGEHVESMSPSPAGALDRGDREIDAPHLPASFGSRHGGVEERRDRGCHEEKAPTLLGENSTELVKSEIAPGEAQARRTRAD
ncbi:MAG: hypothetical protein DMG06_04880 [Acidobacteria bacterium]|nr:MAG: hypothetical protein DMG06_04880 [Acidobacteriota bacterium]